MSATASGTIGLSVNLNVSIPAGVNALNAYTVPINPTAGSSVGYQNGTAAQQISKVFEKNPTATASPDVYDLTAVTCADGSTGFSHVREIIIYNDDTTNVLTVGGGSNPFTPFLAGTTPTITIEPGEAWRKSKPNGTNGYGVDGTHKNFQVDPGANTITYRIIFAGD